MNVNLAIEPRAGYLLVTLTGEYQADSARQIFAQTLDACVEHKLQRVLMDIRSLKTKMPITTLDRYQFVEALAQSRIDHLAWGLESLQFALVETEDQIDPKRFGETVAANRGVNAKATTDIADALAWLGVGVTDA
jgi:hypothetical protein